MPNFPREKYIDIAKFFGIAFVVIGHISSPVDNNIIMDYIRAIVCQFHVPLFFFLSGVFYHLSDSFFHFIVKKIRRLYVPYFVSNFVFLAIYCLSRLLMGHEVILLDNFKHFIKVTVGLAVTPLGGATWFLFTLLECLILYDILNRVCLAFGKRIILSSIVVTLTALAYLLPVPLLIERLMVAISFIHLGDISRNLIKNSVKNLNTRSKYYFSAISLVIICIISRINNPDVSSNFYGNIFLFYCSSVLGIIFSLLISDIISRTKIGIMCADAGRKSMWILIGHFFAFKLVTIIQCCMLQLPRECIFYNPCNIISGAIWPSLYLLFGVFLPLLTSRIVEMFLQHSSK